ncbi:hypothetical protein KQR54_18250 [Mycobacterium gordonae]|nr:hypothetical protein [Mycobacterium gordonae]
MSKVAIFEHHKQIKGSRQRMLSALDKESPGSNKRPSVVSAIGSIAKHKTTAMIHLEELRKMIAEPQRTESFISGLEEKTDSLERSLSNLTTASAALGVDLSDELDAAPLLALQMRETIRSLRGLASE